MRLSFGLVLWLALALAAGAAAQTRTADPSPLDDVLARLEAKGKSVTDFRARFTQEKKVYLLDEPLRSEGRILYKQPGLLRWETMSPEPSTLVIDEEGMKIWEPALDQVEVYEFSGKDALGAILPLFGQSSAELRRGYDVALGPPEAGLVTLALVPKPERMRRVIARIDVSLDAETLLPRRLVTHDPNGDTSTTAFASVEPNVGLDAADLKLEIPAGAQVKKPLGGLPF
jgi:outer membrane lipoprotein carrier protein